MRPRLQQVRVMGPDVNADNDPLRPRPTQDSRGFYMLPQAPMDSGYDVYGKLYGQPAKGGLPVRASDHDDGDTSRCAGVARHRQAPNRHWRHQHGGWPEAAGPQYAQERTGGGCSAVAQGRSEQPVKWWDQQFDKAGTEKLLNLFRTFAPVILVYFNAPDIPFVTRMGGHDGHFHVKLRG